MGSGIFAQIVREIHSLPIVDGIAILTLAVLEGILSVENALVPAILVRALPRHRQKKALAYGILGALVFRFIALLFAGYLQAAIWPPRPDRPRCRPYRSERLSTMTTGVSRSAQWKSLSAVFTGRMMHPWEQCLPETSPA